MYVQGMKVTQQDEGKWLKVVKTNTRYYPEGYETKIVSAHASGGFTTKDNEGDLDTWGLETNNIDVEFKWVLIKPTVTSSTNGRTNIASVVRSKLQVFLNAVSEAEAHGLTIDLTDVTKGVNITFQPPEEEY
jgi:hypothetical protein